MLHVDDSIGLNDLVDHGTNLVFIHSPNLIESVLVRLLKSLELILQLLIELGELFVLDSQVNIFLLVVSTLILKLLNNCTKLSLHVSFLNFVAIDLLLHDILSVV